MYLEVVKSRNPVDFCTLRKDIDIFVDELESEILRLYGEQDECKAKNHTNVNTNFVWNSIGTDISNIPEVMEELESPKSYGPSECSANSTVTRSTVYSDFDHDNSSLDFSHGPNTNAATSELLESALSEDQANKSDSLRPSEILSFCSNLTNICHLKLDIKQMLFGKVSPEMCPDYSPPAVVISCQLGSWKWYTSKNAQQMKALDKVIRSWLSLEHIKLPRLPELNTPSSPRVCHTNHRQMEEYIATISAHLPKLNDHVLSTFARFIENDPVVPSPIFDSSAYCYVKSTVGYKIRFCVFANGVFQIFDAPAGKLLSQIKLYLSSVQRAENTRNTISLQEFDTTCVDIKNQTIISFENDLVCNRWLDMLQSATHTKTPFSHTIAALPYTLTSWKE